ncbi:MAG: hypothetical protein ACWGO1_15155, partial [Anaerolineales bacterium]
RRIANEIGYPSSLVQSQAPFEGATDRAPRHKRGILDITMAMQTLNTKMIDLDRTIERAVSGRYLPG